MNLKDPRVFLICQRALSDVIAEAIVESTRAFLSDDKTGVYSEFTMVVAKVFKQAGRLFRESG